MILTAALAAALSSTASAGQAEPVALTNVRVIDGNGGLPIEGATILIDGTNIVSVGRGIKLPKDVRKRDYSGRTIIPGLISDHSHVGQYQGIISGPAAYTRDNIAAALAQYQQFGVTTISALGNNRPIFVDIRKDAHDRKMPGADLFGVVQGIGAPDGAPPQAMFHSLPDQLFRPGNALEARQAVRLMAQEGTDLVKIWVDDFGGSLPRKMSPDVYRAVIEESHKLGLRVAAHVHDLADAEAVVDAGADILAHGVRDQRITDAFAAEMKARGTWYIPTLALDEATVAWARQDDWTLTSQVRAFLPPQLRQQIDDPEWRRRQMASPQIAAAISSLKINLENLSLLYRVGVKIGFGTDSGATPLRVPGVAEHRELRLMVTAGLSPQQAIGIATKNAAALMQLSDRGTIAAGKRADLVVLAQDPGKDIDAISSIVETWRAGEPTPSSFAVRATDP